jgi:hypothetical protein
LATEASLKEEAEYLRLTLAMGLTTPDEVVGWADGQIAALDEPPIQVVDVSLAGSQPAFEIMCLLSAVPGGADLTRAAHRALGLFRCRFRAGGISLEQAAEMLWAYSIWASVSEDEQLRASNFRYVVNCLHLGHLRTPESVLKEVEEFLTLYLGEAADAVPETSLTCEPSPCA